MDARAAATLGTVSPADPPVLLPRAITVPVVLACLAPILLRALGVDLGSTPLPNDADALALLRGAHLDDALFGLMRGAFVHLVLDWSAVLLALGAGVLALLRHSLRRDAVTAVLGLAMLGAGIVDAFHALVASHILLPAAASHGDPVALSWVISRAWHAGALTLGASIFVLWPAQAQRFGSRALAVVGLAFGGGAWLLVNVLVATASLPTMVHRGALVPRPWDLLPLVLYLVAAGIVLPRLHRQVPSVFTAALLFACIPNAAAELHMMLGAHRPFDSHDNAAHLMRLLAYGVVAAGLVIDYLDQHRRVHAQARDLAASVHAVGLLNKNLHRTVDDLEQFAYAASHDLKAPLRAVASICSWLDEDLKAGRMDDVSAHLTLMRGRVGRAERLLEDLRAYARLGRLAPVITTVNTGALVDSVVDVLAPPAGFSVTRSGRFPTITTARVRLEQVFLNLLGNAIKHHDQPDGRVVVRAEQGPDFIDFLVMDDGPGIPAEHRERVFVVFKTLRPRDDVEGSGMGLAIVKKTVEAAGGRIRLSDNVPRGCVFRFSWPKVWPKDEDR
ncbi:MAG: hypothetical protein GXP62_11840 [Oligoflexia bacterium]|nr:hypothetical protein [Oligoflexia bacterium]